MMSETARRNRFELEARVVERQPVRFTPAGLPIVECTLQYSGEVSQAGLPRQVELTLTARAAGEASDRLSACELSAQACFAGFLAPRRRNSRALVFHITELRNIEKD